MQKPDLSLFPKTPGVYFFKDATGKILYVGKAIRLRNRLASYFRPESTLTPKTRLMVAAASSIDILRTETEKEALLLEASLIKKHRPRYNIVLRDDKEYLLFRITDKHPYPRLEIVRKNGMKKENASSASKELLFGPFSSASAARETWKLIHKSFPLRRCRDRSFLNRTRPCLYHHMGLCLGPCTLDVTEKEYRSVLRKVKMLLSGRSDDLIENIEKDMYTASESMEYEKAAALRDQLNAVRRTIEHQSVVLPKQMDLDIVGVSETENGLALGVVFIRGGLLLDGRNFFWPSLSVEDTPELLTTFLPQYYLQGKATPPRRIVIPWMSKETEKTALISTSSLTTFLASSSREEDSSPWINDCIVEPQKRDESMATASAAEDTKSTMTILENLLSEAAGYPVSISIPKGKDEDRLMIMASSNASEAAKHQKNQSMPDMLANAFKTTQPIQRIEAVDISHTSGHQTKAGMVVFENEQPKKSDYREYSLDEELLESGIEAGDDYAALSFWAKRRVQAGEPWADLVLIDGGKGQLAAVHRTFMEAGVADKFTLASIAKARNEEGHADRRAGNISDRIFLPLRSNPLSIKPGSPELLFLQRVRDTVHDYVIGRHRKARSAAAISGELTRLHGIGPKTAQLLYSHFDSLAAMAEAGAKGLATIPGIGKAKATMLAERIQRLVNKK